MLYFLEVNWKILDVFSDFYGKKICDNLHFKLNFRNFQLSTLESIKWGSGNKKKANAIVNNSR